MKKVFAAMLMLATATLFMTGCTTTVSKEYPGGSLVPQKADYRILGEVTGKGNAKTILGFITLGGEQKFGKAYTTAAAPAAIPLALPFQLPSAKNLAESNAMYDALSKLESADVVLDPKYNIEVSGIPILFESVTVELKAKAIAFTGPSAAK